MEAGTLAEWYISEGSEFSAGDSLARIDTDKASIDFEAQDDGCVAKILLEGGTEDVVVGTPIMVTVEDADDVAAFADFKVDTSTAATPEPSSEPEPVKEVENVEPPPTPAPVAAATPTPLPPAPAASAPPIPPPAAEAVVAAVAPVLSTSWGGFAKINSPIAKTLSANQQSYLDKYGTTGFTAL